MTHILLLAVSILGLSMSEVLSFQINQFTSMDQRDPAVASLGGKTIVVWNSYRQDGDSGGIFARCVDPNGPVGQEFQVNSTTAGNQAEPAAAVDRQGRLIVVWRGPWQDLDDQEIVARLFDPNGAPVTDDVHVNAYSQQAQAYPKVAAGPNGRFLVVWQSDQGPTSTRPCILGRLIDGSGQAVGEELVISDTPNYSTRYPDVAAGPDGRFAVCWWEDRTTDGVRVRILDQDGNPIGGSVKVNNIGASSLSRPAIAFLPDGRLAVAWDGDPNRASDDDIRLRILDPNGRPIGEEVVMNTTTSGAQQYPRLAVTADGVVLMVWEGPAPNGIEGIKVFGRVLDPSSGPGPEMLVSDRQGGQRSPVAASIDTGLLIVWEDQQNDGSGSGIFGTILAGPGR